MKKCVAYLSLMAVSAALAAEPAAVETAERKGPEFDAGLDLRFRYEFKDNWMDKGKTSVNPDYEDYYRMRTRVWGKVTLNDDLSAYLRLGNEFRDYRNSTGSKHKNEFPDELYVDSLYLDFNNIADRVDLRLGRQDIKMGAGRLISDGTPGDGSRSAFFDAILAKVKLMEKSDIELMGTWNHYRNELVAGNPYEDYDMTKVKSGSPYSRMDEKGLVAYFHFNEGQNFPMEFYWIWKQEDRFYDKDARYPGRNFHTLGTRLLPKLTDNLTAEVEAAVQLGRTDGQTDMPARDLAAWMLYAGLTWSEKEVFGKPKLTGAFLYLSGDEDSYYKTADGSTDTGWNPVFNRASWFSEVCSGMYDQYRWSNLIYPHIEAGIEPHAKHKVKLQCGPMFAAEKDNGATDNYRGLYTQLRYDFPLLSKIFGKRGDITGAVVGEALLYGDYYAHDQAGADAATWLRFELNGKF